MSKSDVLAFDRQSARSFDKDGRMHVSKTNISKADVNPYYGKEIPNSKELGLDENKVYMLYRHPDELAKAASTFNNLPLLNKHIPVSSKKPEKENVVGSIGSDVSFEYPYLQSSMSVWDDPAIAGVESEKQCEISSAYYYIAVMTPGEVDGKKYDGIMTNICGNHVALVEIGRAGHDVVVADHQTVFLPATKKKEIDTMKMTKLGKAIFVSMKSLSPKLAQDSAFAALVGDAEGKTFDKVLVTKTMLAMDEELDKEKIDEIFDAVLGIEEPNYTETEKVPPVEDEEDELYKFLAGKLSQEDLEAVKTMMKPATASDEVPVDKEELVKTAMDAMRAEFKQLEQAKVDVRPVVGDVLGMDSAEQVYRFALDHLKVDHKDMPSIGLKTMFNAVKGQSTVKPNHTQIAQDSKPSELLALFDRLG